MRVEQALNLAFSPKKKVRRSFARSSNPRSRTLNTTTVRISDELKVKTIYVEEGMSLKRFTARAKGRGNGSQADLSHLPVGRGLRVRMGQKIHPTGFRLAVTRDWTSRWFAPSGDYSKMLHEDLKVREYLKEEAVARLGG